MEYTENLKIFADVDVLVAGAGPAGIGAALRAAREGMSVLVVEMQDCIGGIATAGMMSHWGGRSSSKIMQEIFERSYEKAQAVGWCDDNNCNKDAIFHDVQKVVLDEMFLEAGIKVLFYTTVVDIIKDGDQVKSAIIQNKSGRFIVNAKRFIDSTGDGDLAFKAGVPFFKGREDDGAMQPGTIMFKIGGVDYSKAIFPHSFECTVDVPKGEIQALGKINLPFPAGHVLLYRSPTPNTVCVNMTNYIGVDGTDADSVSKALIECRSQIIPIIKFLKEYAPGYENCYLMSTASLFGIRETRHFEGEKSLGAQDILQAKVFEDWVVKRAWFNFDVHNITGSGLDKTGVQKEWAQQGDYSIPYGCLVPKKVENVLLSGRNISGSHLAHSNFRIMSVCIALGEAAGVAAAISIKKGISIREVNPKDIQSIVGE